MRLGESVSVCILHPVSCQTIPLTPVSLRDSNSYITVTEGAQGNAVRSWVKIGRDRECEEITRVDTVCLPLPSRVNLVLSKSGIPLFLGYLTRIFIRLEICTQEGITIVDVKCEKYHRLFIPLNKYISERMTIKRIL